MIAAHPDMATRLKGAAGAVFVQLLLALILIDGLSFAVHAPRHSEIAVFDVTPPPPPLATVAPRREKSRKHEGKAAPANLTARPSEIVAPPPVLPPPPLLAAPIAAKGPDPSAGASNRPGPGTGAGGVGNGTGSGGVGNGTGGGGTPLVWVSGSIRDSDYPHEALKHGIGGTVGLRFTVGVKGRVTDCSVTRSSDNADLDATTCRLIVQRFRYRPTLDAQGHPVPDVVTGEHVWEVYGRDEGNDPEG